MKTYRIFTNDRGGSKYSALRDAQAKDRATALKLARVMAFTHEKVWAVEWPPTSEADKQWLRRHVGKDL